MHKTLRNALALFRIWFAYHWRALLAVMPVALILTILLRLANQPGANPYSLINLLLIPALLFLCLVLAMLTFRFVVNRPYGKARLSLTDTNGLAQPFHWADGLRIFWAYLWRLFALATLLGWGLSLSHAPDAAIDAALRAATIPLALAAFSCLPNRTYGPRRLSLA